MIDIVVKLNWEGPKALMAINKALDEFLGKVAETVAMQAVLKAPRDSGRYARSIKVKRNARGANIHNRPPKYHVIFGRASEDGLEDAQVMTLEGRLVGDRPVALGAILEYGARTRKGQRRRKREHVYDALRSAIAQHMPEGSEII